MTISAEIVHDHARSLMDFSTKLFQFLVIASIAIVGWLIESEEFRELAPFDTERCIWTIIFFFLCASVGGAILSAVSRINACYRLLKTTASDINEFAAFREGNIIAIGAAFGLIFAIFAVCALTLGNEGLKIN